MHQWMLIVALVAPLVGCKKNESKPAESKTAVPDKYKPAPAGSAEPDKEKPEPVEAADKAEAPKPAVDACVPFTDKDATAAFGQPMKRADGTEGNPGCSLMSVDRGAKAVTLDYRIFDNLDMFKANEKSATAVTGIGDKAVWAETVNQLIVVKGGHTLVSAIIGADYTDHAKARAKSEEIAKKILEKM